jgi:hypothetical protein
MWPWPDHLLSPNSRPDEGERPTSWRQLQLLRAGFAPALAAMTAHQRGMDLHALIELVEHGCPPPLAVRILAPLDEDPPC